MFISRRVNDRKQKSIAYYFESKIPTFSFDSGLYTDMLPEDKQPGLHVRSHNTY